MDVVKEDMREYSVNEEDKEDWMEADDCLWRPLKEKKTRINEKCFQNKGDDRDQRNENKDKMNVNYNVAVKRNEITNLKNKRPCHTVNMYILRTQYRRKFFCM